jgi:hypothetical protein
MWTELFLWFVWCPFSLAMLVFLIENFILSRVAAE